jgi:hypothetical protein
MFGPGEVPDPTEHIVDVKDLRKPKDQVYLRLLPNWRRGHRSGSPWTWHRTATESRLTPIEGPMRGNAHGTARAVITCRILSPFPNGLSRPFPRRVGKTVGS